MIRIGLTEVHRLRLAASQDTPIQLAVAEDRTLAQDGVDPCFSPDGKVIAYQNFADPSGSADFLGITLVSPDGQQRRRFIADAEQPAW